MPKRVLCKFFAHGACLKGDHCEYLHEWNAAPNNVCTFYQKGACSYGNRCRYDHVKPSRMGSAASSSTPSPSSNQAHCSAPQDFPASAVLDVVHSSNKPTELVQPNRHLVNQIKPVWNQVPVQHDLADDDDLLESTSVQLQPADRSICSFASVGNCPRGEDCPHIHGDLCMTCGKHCLHPFRPEEREEHTRSCGKKQKQLESLKLSQDIECSVCLDRVLSKPIASERKFGILSECDHPFCVTCIRNWRNSSPTTGMDVNNSLRACPICRKLSYFVVPSVIWYTTKEEKQEIMDNYKAKLKSIDCKHFNFGNGNCPFGTSCFYKHWVKPGSYTWKYRRPPPRHPNRRDRVSMDDVFDMFEHLLSFEDLIWEEDLNFIDEDPDDEDLTPLERAFLLAQLGSHPSDSSTDDDE